MAPGNFEPLKSEIVFHENRLRGLYESALGDEITFWLEDKTNNRNDARKDCEQAMRKAEIETVMPSGNKWTATRIPAYLRLELECRFLVGSEEYEAPEKATRESMYTLLQHIEDLQTGMNTRNMHSLEHVKTVMQQVDWSEKDTKTLTEALTAKADLLGELSKLFSETQERAWAISRLEAKKEELFRKEDRANADGEAAIATEILYDRLVLHEDMLRICEEKLNMVHQSIEACMKQKQAKSSGWKLGAATLEVLKEAKVARQEVCREDLDRLRRGMEYEFEQRQESQRANEHQLMMNQQSFDTLNAEMLESTQRLFSLAEEFKKEEKKLHGLVQNRNLIVAERLEIIAAEAQIESDFKDFIAACKRHEENLQQSIVASKVASDALQVLQEYSAGNSSFFGQDFTQANEQLKVMHMNILREMNAMHNEYVKDGLSMIRRLELQQKTLETSLVEQEMFAEQMKEILNPMAKKFVDECRRLEAERKAMIQEVDAVKKRMGNTEQRYFERVKKELGELNINIETPGEDIEWKFLMKQEQMIDIREKLMERPVDRVLDENDHLQLAEQAVGEFIDRRVNRMPPPAGVIVGSSSVSVVPGMGSVGSSQRRPVAGAKSPSAASLSASTTAKSTAPTSPTLQRAIPRESRVVASYVTGSHVPRPMEIRNPRDPPPPPPAAESKQENASITAAGSPMGRLTPIEMGRNKRNSEPRTIASLKFDPNKKSLF